MALSQEDNLLIQSYFTTAFLFELNNNDFLNSEFYKSLSFGDNYLKENLPTVGIDNQGTLLMGLYTMLVLPKEILSQKYPTEFNGLNNVIDTIQSASKSDYKSDSSGIDYIRHIRNSVAHAKVEFVPTISVTFTDQNSKGEICTITIPLEKVGVFLTALQSVFMKYIKVLQTNSTL
ncbi:hypothetical protein [Flavobacterium humi]|uniref:pEK499-p136 HEPN domain-containing protein n=1 Tax=Flavobacterium humi TaxID=2562683 RepID=A0A4Z0L2V2_9FLAO|nr:hypothetical protein [Flavobacterium humi]TGD56544.1 hypothetical protein E4635_15600 [Flavobacterium humi]